MKAVLVTLLVAVLAVAAFAAPNIIAKKQVRIPYPPFYFCLSTPI